MGAVKVEILHDPDTESPRNWECVGIMHCAHKRYNLGDPGAETPFVDDDWHTAVVRDDVLVWRPIYLYDHSGITISHTPFECRWDSGLLGWHYVRKETAHKEWPNTTGDELIAKAEHMLECELKVYDAFIRGDCWGYRVLDADGEETDACWGIIGTELEDTGILDNIDESLHAAAREAWENRHDAS